MNGDVPSDHGFDLLRFAPLRRLVRWGGFPRVFQVVFLLGFLALAWLGWGALAPDGVSSKDFAKTNLVTLLIWGLWWPVMIWVAVFFGRLWCAVCPLELVASLGESCGRALGLSPRALGRWLRSGVVILALYTVIQMLVAGVHLHRVPAFTSIFLVVLLLGSVLVGMMFKDRAFCRGFCPVGLLLATYGRGSMLAVRAQTGAACGDPVTDTAAADRGLARSCPSLLNPARLDKSSDCLICASCIQSEPPEGRMGLYLRRPFHSADARESPASWVLTLFVMLLSGFVAYELTSEWPAAKAAFLAVPQAISSSMGLAPDDGWVKGIWTLLLFPLLLWSVLGGLVLLGRGARTLGEAWRRIALPLVPIIAAGHMAKGLAKLSSWGGYLPGDLADPGGVQRAEAIGAGVLEKPEHLLPKAVVALIGLGFLMILAAFALRENRLAGDGRHRARLAPILAAAVATFCLIGGWASWSFVP